MIQRMSHISKQNTIYITKFKTSIDCKMWSGTYLMYDQDKKTIKKKKSKQ